MQQIGDWLEKLGLEQYTQRFAENGINFAALPHLTDLGPQGCRRPARASADNARGYPGAWERCSTATRYGRVEAPRHRRTPPSHGDVLGSCGLHGTFGAHGP